MTKRCVICYQLFEVKSESKRRICIKCSLKMRNAYQRSWQLMNYHAKNQITNEVRASGKTYENSPEKISFLKEKYKNGVPKGEIEKWIGGL